MAVLLAFRYGGAPVHAPCPEPKASAVLTLAWANAGTTAVSIASLTVTAAGALTVSGTVSITLSGSLALAGTVQGAAASSLALAVAGSALVSGTLTMSGSGYASGAGPATALSTGGGGGHAGCGAQGGAACDALEYGSAFSPTAWGSGGGAGSAAYATHAGGAGGGALLLDVAGSLALTMQSTCRILPISGYWSGHAMYKWFSAWLSLLLICSSQELR